MKSRQRYLQHNLRQNNFVKFLYYACFFLALTTEEEIGPRSGRADPSFSVRPEKEAKGAVLHGTSAAGVVGDTPPRVFLLLH
ncbi:MAG: hypothetical protein SPF51_08360, partial [Candidatus Fimivicinus sp.]|nr:hypothetical protein [Candidatus Fimivicinus sp.]